MNANGEEVVMVGLGSIIKDPKELKEIFEGEWHPDGPLVQIALARKSRGRNAVTRVTLEGASPEKTMYRKCKVGMNDAIKALRKREGISEANKHLIAYINFKTGKSRCSKPEVYEIIKKWGLEKGVAGVIWTDLSSNINFDEEYMRMPVGSKTRSAVIERMLRDDPELKRNTQKYVELIPLEMRSALEKRILLM